MSPKGHTQRPGWLVSSTGRRGPGGTAESSPGIHAWGAPHRCVSVVQPRMSRREEGLWLIGFALAVLAVAAALLGAFAGVGRWEAARVGERGRTISLVFSGWGGIEERQVFSGLVTEFMRRHPEIAVQYQPIPRDYVQKLKTMIAGGVPPDVF